MHRAEPWCECYLSGCRIKREKEKRCAAAAASHLCDFVLISFVFLSSFSICFSVRSIYFWSFFSFRAFYLFIYVLEGWKRCNMCACACLYAFYEWMKAEKKIKGAFLCWFVEYCCCSNWASNYMSVLCDAQSADNMCEYVMRIERPCHGTTIVWELFTGGNVILVRLCLCVTFRYSSFCLCSFSISFNHFSMCWSFYIGSPK